MPLRSDMSRRSFLMTTGSAAVWAGSSRGYSAAEMRTKAEIVSGFKSGSFKYQSRGISDLNVRVYGDAAVVTGRSIQKGTENGKDYSGDYWFTRVYVKQGGRWITVALQTTPIQKQ